MVSSTVLDPTAAATSEADDASRERVTRMVKDHHDAVWRTLRRLGMDASGADDGAQQTFLVAARRVQEIRPGEERSYLLGVAVRVASDARRATKRRNAAIEKSDLRDSADGQPAADELLGRKRARELVDQILERMEESSREAFVLFELEGLTGPEIATILDVPLGTVASRLKRARELFREAVARSGKGERK